LKQALGTGNPEVFVVLPQSLHTNARILPQEATATSLVCLNSLFISTLFVQQYATDNASLKTEEKRQKAKNLRGRNRKQKDNNGAGIVRPRTENHKNILMVQVEQLQINSSHSGSRTSDLNRQQYKAERNEARIATHRLLSRNWQDARAI
jgi:hypothetical protein